MLRLGSIVSSRAAVSLRSLTVVSRFQSTTSPLSSSSTASSSGAQAIHASRVSAAQLAERCAAARLAIFELWTEQSQQVKADLEQSANDARAARTLSLLEKFQISPTVSRDEDIVRGLGEAFDRLLLLTVPLSSKGDTLALETLLSCAGRQGREISVKTIQHLFSRAASYAEAIAIFHTMRKCNVAMNMEAYHAMLYSLQRLEEESWALKFADELDEKKEISEQAFDFMLNGCDNQLLPESKPWLGRVMYKEDPTYASAQAFGKEDYEALNAQWVNRYKSQASNE